MEATAFARAPQPTAAGTEAHDGTIAADPRILPLGTRIRIAGAAGFDGAGPRRCPQEGHRESRGAGPKLII